MSLLETVRNANPANTAVAEEVTMNTSLEPKPETKEPTLVDDKILNLQVDIDSIKADEVIPKAKELLESDALNWLEIAGLLYRISKDQLYKDDGFKNFTDFIDNSGIDIGYRNANKRIEMYEGVVNLGITWDMVKEVKWTKTHLLIAGKVLTTDNVDEWINRAKGMSKDQLEQEIKLERNRLTGKVEPLDGKHQLEHGNDGNNNPLPDYEGPEAGDEDYTQLLDDPNKLPEVHLDGDDLGMSPGRTSDADLQQGATQPMTFSFYPDQKEVVVEALAASKIKNNTEVNSAALEFICLSWLASQNGEAPTKSLREQLKDMNPVDIKAVLDELHPDANFSINI